MSRKLFYFILIITVSVATFGCFTHQASSKFIGPDKSAYYKTVKDILSHPVDDVPVHLKGKITEKIAWDRYIFSDDTGSITVRIKPSRIDSLNVTPKTKIEIFGEVDVKHIGTIEIDVARITLLQDEVADGK